jgi:hypothetical protein
MEETSAVGLASKSERTEGDTARPEKDFKYVLRVSGVEDPSLGMHLSLNHFMINFRTLIIPEL